MDVKNFFVQKRISVHTTMRKRFHMGIKTPLKFAKESQQRLQIRENKTDDAVRDNNATMVREKQNATMQFATMQFGKNKTQRCSSRKRRNDAFREKQNATMQFAKNKTRQCSSWKRKRNAAVRENDAVCKIATVCENEIATLQKRRRNAIAKTR